MKDPIDGVDVKEAFTDGKKSLEQKRKQKELMNVVRTFELAWL